MKRLLVCLLILCLLPLAVFAEDASDALYPVRVDGLWGYMNREGEIVIEPQFPYAAEFRGRYAAVMLDEDETYCYCGIIDADGNWAVEPGRFTVWEADQGERYIGGRDEGIYILFGEGENYRVGFFDLPSGFYSGLVYDWVEGEWIGEWDSELTAVEMDGKDGFVRRTDGELVIPCRYDACRYYLFHEGCCAVLPDGAGPDEWILIDSAGNEIPLPENCYVSGDPSEGLAAIWDSENNLYGYMNFSGNVVIAPQYVWAYDFHEGLACVFLTEESCAVITPENEIVAVLPDRVNRQGSGYEYVHGLLRVAHYSEDDDLDYIAFFDHEGREAFRLEIGDLIYAYDLYENGVGFYVTGKKDPTGGHTDVRYGLYNAAGEILTGPAFFVWENGPEPAFAEGLCALTDAETGKMGFIDVTGQWIIAAEWDDAENFYYDLALVEKDGKLAYIDHEGTTVWEESAP